MIEAKSKLKFRKMGQVVSHEDGFYSGNQCPVPQLLNDQTLRIYYTARGKDNKTYPFYVDLDAYDPNVVRGQSKSPLIQFGSPGTFDDMGIVPSQVRETKEGVYLYYQGFNISSPARYRTAIGVVIDKGQGFERRDYAILDRSPYDPIAVGTPFIFGEMLFYLSHAKWEYSELSAKHEPFYSIKQSRIESNERLIPSREGFIFEISDGVGGMARPWVWLHHGAPHMIYCKRGSGDYRLDPSQTYKIECAQLKEGQWIPVEIEFVGEPELMMAYPSLVETKFGTYLFYNNDFTSALQMAVLCD